MLALSFQSPLWFWLCLPGLKLLMVISINNPKWELSVLFFRKRDSYSKWVKVHEKGLISHFSLFLPIASCISWNPLTNLKPPWLRIYWAATSKNTEAKLIGTTATLAYPQGETSDHTDKALEPSASAVWHTHTHTHTQSTKGTRAPEGSLGGNCLLVFRVNTLLAVSPPGHLNSLRGWLDGQLRKGIISNFYLDINREGKKEVALMTENQKQIK